MKKYFFMLCSIMLMTACEFTSNNASNTEDSTAIQNTEDYDRITEPVMRDTSINAANAYNNLFLDDSLLETYFTGNNVAPADANQIRNFYNGRNFEYAWFSNDGLTDEARNFWNAWTYINGKEQQVSPALDKKSSKKLDSLLNSSDTILITASDTTFVNLEMAITQKFIVYRQQQNLQHVPLWQLLPTKKIDAIAMADSIQMRPSSADTTQPVNAFYEALKKQLVLYTGIAKRNDTAIRLSGKFKKGSSSAAIPAIKERLRLNGYLQGNDTSRRFNDTLEMAVKAYQQSRGVKTTGIIDDTLISTLNTAPTDRIKQLLVNMNRIHWMPTTLRSNYIQVNIPDFMLKVFEGNTKQFEMPVVVGSEGTNTMMFSGDLNQVVFAPYWNIPASIVQKEILPAMNRDPNYLKSRHMEITGKRDSLPVIRQLPGAGNALGKVKFLFPNSYDIYLHDTEAKQLFNAKNRAFSHGCIRIADAEKMANYVLRDQKEWTPEKIHAAMNGNKEQFVKVKEPLPVIITYFTIWVDEEGKLQFRDDVYGHDAKTVRKLFSN